jgi:capsular exopolysaccharide synthesis family protein
MISDKKSTPKGSSKSDMAVSAIFGKLKANIDFSFVDVKNMCLMVTSSLPNEGKTTIAANTAAAMAAAGKKTLFIDADMRNATVHLLFNLVNATGLSDIISQNTPWKDCLVKSSIPNLSIITAGRKPLNTTKFIGSVRFREFIETVKHEYDYVVIDTPPILLLPDAQIISPIVDGVIVVVNSGKTKQAELKASGELLKRANANVIGAVLNNVDTKSGSYGYGYGYGYGYYGNYGNYSDDAPQTNARRVDEPVKVRPGNSSDRK